MHDPLNTLGWYNDGEAAGGEGSPQRNQLQEKIDRSEMEALKEMGAAGASEIVVMDDMPDIPLGTDSGDMNEAVGGWDFTSFP